MKKEVRQTSLEVYQIEQEKFNHQEKIIFDWIKQQPFHVTRREIAMGVNMETSTVSARVNSLLKKKILMIYGRKECPYSKNNVEAIQVIT